MSRSAVSRLALALALAATTASLSACSSSSAAAPVTVASNGACEALLGTPSSVVQGLTLDHADNFAWQSDIMDSNGKPLGCTLKDTPPTATITFWVYRTSKKCAVNDTCSAVVKGAFIEMSFTKNGPSGLTYPKPADSAATVKWLTTVAGRL